jgi:hypothetical protein
LEVQFLSPAPYQPSVDPPTHRFIELGRRKHTTSESCS